MTWVAFDASAPPTENERPPLSSLPPHARVWLRAFVPPPPIAQKPHGPSKLVNLRGLLGRLGR